MAQLKNEVVIFHKYSREGYKDMTRDDLGLWSGAEGTDSKPQQTGNVVAEVLNKGRSAYSPKNQKRPSRT